MFCPRPQNLVRTARCSEWVRLDEGLPFLWWRCKVGVSIEIALFELDGFDFHGLDLLEIFLIVQAISKNIAECAQ